MVKYISNIEMTKDTGAKAVILLGFLSILITYYLASIAGANSSGYIVLAFYAGRAIRHVARIFYIWEGYEEYRKLPAPSLIDLFMGIVFVWNEETKWLGYVFLLFYLTCVIVKIYNSYKEVRRRKKSAGRTTVRELAYLSILSISVYSLISISIIVIGIITASIGLAIFDEDSVADGVDVDGLGVDEEISEFVVPDECGEDVSDNLEEVSGYVRSDGVKVDGYVRTVADSSPYNNLSS